MAAGRSIAKLAYFLPPFLQTAVPAVIKGKGRSSQTKRNETFPPFSCASGERTHSASKKEPSTIRGWVVAGRESDPCQADGGGIFFNAPRRKKGSALALAIECIAVLFPPPPCAWGSTNPGYLEIEGEEEREGHSCVQPARVAARDFHHHLPSPPPFSHRVRPPQQSKGLHPHTHSRKF